MFVFNYIDLGISLGQNKNRKNIMTLDEVKNKKRELKAQLSTVAIESEEVSTSNIIHLVASVFTMGLWLIPWFVCVMQSRKEKRQLAVKTVKLTTQLEKLEELLEDDVEGRFTGGRDPVKLEPR
jgi:hypothetical protein|tara:strand:- start:276 stop:647 length:372 start_codon:yes stop_codon:yes gene_type:complete